MKFLKRFNEELSPEVYRSAAEKIEAGEGNDRSEPRGVRATNLRRHADKMEGKKYLLYYAFDWDDNILNMTTVIHMEHLVDGEWMPEDVSTSRFAEVRNDKDNWKILGGDPELAFSEFRDNGPRGEVAFLEDVKESISNGKFGPAWDDFLECLSKGSLFAIITARGHESAAMRKGVEWIIDNELSEDKLYSMYNNLLKFAYLFKDESEYPRILKGQPSKDRLVSLYLDNCDFVGVSAPSRGGSPANPEKAKEEALLQFKDKINTFSEKIGFDAKVGFSDDDLGNVKHIEDLIDKLHNEQFPRIKEMIVKGTKDPENITKKIRSFENFSPAVLNSLPNAGMSGGMNSQNPFVTRTIQQSNLLKKLSKEIFGEHEPKRKKRK